MSQQDYENGLKVRTEVMGESFVKRAQDNTVPFTQPLQDWINEHAWGSTWQREGVLPRKYRSLITIAFLTAQKSPTELKGHVRGALNNGATVDDIQEVFLLSLPYCGALAKQGNTAVFTVLPKNLPLVEIRSLSAELVAMGYHTQFEVNEFFYTFNVFWNFLAENLVTEKLSAEI